MTEAERWLAQAERDLDDARFAASGSRWNLACFLSQQAAEKALKAYLYASGAETVRGHSVAELCRDAAGQDAAFRELGADVSALDQYYIPTRYPNGLPGTVVPHDFYGEKEAQECLDLAESLLKLTSQTIDL